MKRKRIQGFFAGLFVIILTCGYSQAQCQGDNGSAVVRVYSFAVAYPERLQLFVNNKDVVKYFKSNSPSINCGREFAQQLRQNAIAGPTYNQIYQRAVNVAGNAGVPQMASDLADSMNQHNTDMTILADYISELVYALPFITQNNLTPYHNSRVYQISSLLWNQTQGVLLPQQFQALRFATLEMNKWYVGYLLNAMD